MTEPKFEQTLRVGVPYAQRLVIMVKEPVAGRVKTRLGRDIGTAEATRLYRHTLGNVTARLACDPRWQTLLSVAPKRGAQSRMLPRLPRIAQPGGDIGIRMQSILNWTVPGPIVVIGTDIPQVDTGHIARAFDALGSHDVVFGPASDGGFWLIGMGRSPRVIDAFGDVRWSTSHTLSDCLAGLRGHKVGFVDELIDVDEISDLSLIKPTNGRRILPKPQ